jgi:hypothetical protein
MKTPIPQTLAKLYLQKRGERTYEDFVYSNGVNVCRSNDERKRQ